MLMIGMVSNYLDTLMSNTICIFAIKYEERDSTVWLREEYQSNIHQCSFNKIAVWIERQGLLLYWVLYWTHLGG